MTEEQPMGSAGAATYLPSSLTSFIGRTAELDELTELLGQTRLLTLTGAGGSGKTRLALECARRVAADFREDVRWTDLSALATADLLAAEVARSVGVAILADERVDDALEQSLAHRQVLLVVDNCEHLVDAVAQLVHRLVLACPHVRVLATSREPLGLSGEQVWPVTPMTVPAAGAASAEDVASAEAVALFVDRVARVRPSFRLDHDNAADVGLLCRRLDGIPLAIELAAARARAMPPSQIVASLDDRFTLLRDGGRTAPPRQRTLEASVAWSHDLLAEPERLLLARLSVFAGTFGLDDVEAVCSDQALTREEALEALPGLVDQSMVVFDESSGLARYRLLETIRIYAQARLAELDEVERVRRRHLAAQVESAERVRAELLDDIETALHRFDLALDNLRAAMDWAMTSAEPLSVLSIIRPTFNAWLVRGLYAEVTSRLSEALSSEQLPAVDRARGLADASQAALMAGEYDGSHDFAEASLALQHGDADAGLLARSHVYRAWSGFHSGRGTTRQVFGDLDRATELVRSVDDPLLRTQVHTMAGWVEACGRSVSDGRALLQDALATAEQLGAPSVQIRTWLAQTCMFAAARDDAAAHAHEAVRAARNLGYDAFVIMALTTLGSITALSGELERGRSHFDDAARLATKSGQEAFAIGVHAQRAMAEALLGDTDAAENEVLTASSLASGIARGRGAPDDVGDHTIRHFVDLARGFVSLRRGDDTGARVHFSRGRTGSSDPMALFTFTLASSWLARIAAHAGRSTEAWSLGHEGLEVAHRGGLRVLLPSVLETIGGIAAIVDRHEVSARLLGASAGLQAASIFLESPLDERWRARSVDEARNGLDDAEFDRLWSEGHVQAVDEIVAYVQRGRGTRGRPRAGWDSLTPAELQVVELVARGGTNAEIAEQLFVSVNTVRSHLSHVYTKLSLSNRTELAAEVARRDG